MIPKIIHYCWFGKNPYPQDFQTFLKGWKEMCPDFQIIEWNEKNFDVESNLYIKQAYQSKKWAFVTDYVRLWALYHYGGVYMDTDVEVLKPLDVFLDEKAFSGFESVKSVPTGIMGAEKGNQTVKALLDEYDARPFMFPDGTLNLHTNVEYFTDFFTKRGLKVNNRKQTVEGFTFYPSEYFCPKNSRTLEIVLTDNSYTIHHFAGSWTENKTRVRNKIKKILGPALMSVVIKIMDKLGIK